MKKIFMVVAILMVMNPVYAETVGISGQGNMSCRVWADARKLDDVNTIAYEAWVQGFLTGVNWTGVMNTDLIKGSNKECWFTWMDNYCLKNPRNRIIDGAYIFVFELESRSRCDCC